MRSFPILPSAALLLWCSNNQIEVHAFMAPTRTVSPIAGPVQTSFELLKHEISGRRSSRTSPLFMSTYSEGVSEENDLYRILRISRDATVDEIKNAYRKLVKLYHPDANREKDTTDEFRRISSAYKVLKNPASKEQYDLFAYGSTKPPWMTNDISASKATVTKGQKSDYFSSRFNKNNVDLGPKDGFYKPPPQTTSYTNVKTGPDEFTKTYSPSRTHGYGSVEEQAIYSDIGDVDPSPYGGSSSMFDSRPGERPMPSEELELFSDPPSVNLNPPWMDEEEIHMPKTRAPKKSEERVTTVKNVQNVNFESARRPSPHQQQQPQQRHVVVEENLQQRREREAHEAWRQQNAHSAAAAARERRQQEVMSKQRQAINDQRKAMDERKKAANNRRQAMNNQSQSMNNQRQSMNNQRPAMNNQRQPMNNQRQAPNNHRQPMNNQRQAPNMNHHNIKVESFEGNEYSEQRSKVASQWKSKGSSATSTTSSGYYRGRGFATGPQNPYTSTTKNIAEPQQRVRRYAAPKGVKQYGAVNHNQHDIHQRASADFARPYQKAEASRRSPFVSPNTAQSKTTSTYQNRRTNGETDVGQRPVSRVQSRSQSPPYVSQPGGKRVVETDQPFYQYNKANQKTVDYFMAMDQERRIAEEEPYSTDPATDVDFFIKADGDTDKMTGKVFFVSSVYEEDEAAAAAASHGFFTARDAERWEFHNNSTNVGQVY